jgi:cytochrome c-type biogenesis protein CcmH/NrfG
MLLGRTSHLDESRRELEASLRVDPNFADAHELLGDLSMARNRTQEAIPRYCEALRIRPESVRAHLGLGAALVAIGDINGAVPHLQQAAAGPDGATR